MGFCTKRARCVAPILFCVGAAAVIVCCVVRWKIVPDEVQNEIKKNLALDPSNTDTWDSFVEPPVPIYLSFRFFDIANSEEVKKNGSKPHLVERGPYVYSSIKRKIDILRDGQATLSYSDFRNYTYDQEATNKAGCAYDNRKCTKDDDITIIHPIIAFMGTLFDKIDWTGLGSLKPVIVGLINSNTGEGKDDIFLETTVDSILYEGQDIQILRVVFTLLDLFASQIPPQVADAIDSLPSQISPQGKFGFFLGDAGKAKFRYRVNDGQNDLAMYLQFEAFQGSSSLPPEWWSPAAVLPEVEEQSYTTKNTCFDLRGTDGTQFAPGVEGEKDLWIFSSELCRSFWLSYEEEVEIKGITTKQFHPEKEVFSMAKEENKCFCPEFESCRKLANDNQTYLMDDCKADFLCVDGVLKMSGCFGGAPIFMSQPHFLNGDPVLFEKIDGLNPSKSLHDTVLNVEPMTGVVMSAHKRIQVSLEVKAAKELTVFAPVVDQWNSSFLFPVFWGDEGADIDDENADLFKDMVATPLNVANGVTLTFIVLGSLLIFASWALILFAKK